MIYDKAHKDVFTLSNGTQAGERLLLALHRVEVLSVIEECAEYAICRVRVLGPVPGSAGQFKEGDTFKDIPIPPMMWHGEPYDSAGVFEEQERATQ